MTQPELRLPRYAREVLDRFEESELALLGRAGAALGGGTVLASRWGEHRESRDLDIFIAAPRFDALFPLINKMQMELQARLDPSVPSREWSNHEAGVLVIRVQSTEATVELIRDPQRPVTRDWTHGDETIAGTSGRLKTVSTSCVLQRKIENRIHALAERDVYDLAWAARFDPPNLDRALEHCSYVRVQNFADTLQNMTAVPIRPEDDKPVVRPRWESWRTEAPPVLRRTIGEALTRWHQLDRNRSGTSIGQ